MEGRRSNETYEARPVRMALRLLSVESTHFFILLSASFVTPATSPSIVTAMRLGIGVGRGGKGVRRGGYLPSLTDDQA